MDLGEDWGEEKGMGGGREAPWETKENQRVSDQRMKEWNTMINPLQNEELTNKGFQTVRRGGA